MKSFSRVAIAALAVVTTVTVSACDRRNTPETVTTAPTVTPTPTLTPIPTPTPVPPPTTAPATGQATGQGNGETAINPPRQATLTAQQSGAQINLRSQPNAQSGSKGYGLVGDKVTLLRITEGADSYSWYYVKFSGSGAEGWVRGDFINTQGEPTAAASQSTAARSVQCKGVFDETVFTATYSNGSFTRIEFRNLESNATFGGPLRSQGENGQGQPVFTGAVSPPAGGSYSATLIDLSGGNPTPGSQVALEYADIPATGTCE
ncbi:MAG TPA: SH3 domain-containing protein [Trichocoleus sp.]